MPPESRSASFIPVACGCGRSLRAKPDQAGTEIQCWDCHRMVMVSTPRERQKVARELSGEFLGVIRGPSLVHVLLAAAALTAALGVPGAGLVLAGLVLALGAAVYGEVIRRVSRTVPEESPPGWSRLLIPRTVPKALICLLMAAGTVVPLWAIHAGVHQSPRWSIPGLAIAALAWTILPVAMLCLEGSDRNGRLGTRTALKLMARHPFAILAALVVVPASLVLVEAGFGAAFYLAGKLPFFALDFMPMPGKPEMHDGIPFYFYVDYRSFPPTRFLAAYLDGLRHGYWFGGAIPASLSLPTRNGLNPSILGMNQPGYFAFRVALSFLVAAGLMASAAIQARWLGVIAAVEKKRPA